MCAPPTRAEDEVQMRSAGRTDARNTSAFTTAYPRAASHLARPGWPVRGRGNCSAPASGFQSLSLITDDNRWRPKTRCNSSALGAGIRPERAIDIDGFSLRYSAVVEPHSARRVVFGFPRPHHNKVASEAGYAQ